MKAFEVLNAAHTLLTGSGWSQGANARDAGGNPVELLRDRKINPAAVTFSIYGAIVAAGIKEPQPEANLMWNTLRDEAQKRYASGQIHPLVAFNDHEGQTQAGVLAFLLDVANLCEKASSVLAEARAS